MSELWSEGAASFHNGDFDRAADRFDRAYHIDRSPATGLWVARSLERAGKLLEAVERYREVAELGAGTDPSLSGWEARRTAERERQQLLPLVPALRIDVVGVPTDQVRVTVNGRPFPNSLLGVRRSLNPGLNLVEGVSAQLRVVMRVDLARAQSETVLLDFTPKPDAIEPAVALSPEEERRASWKSGRRVAAYVATGVGGAALLTGAMFGWVAIRDRDRLASECPNRRCPARLASRVDTYESEKRAATIGIVSGLGFGAVGLLLYIGASTEPPASSVSVGLSGHGLELGGTF